MCRKEKLRNTLSCPISHANGTDRQTDVERQETDTKKMARRAIKSHADGHVELRATSSLLF
jgi:hypothetical protein